MPRSKKRKKNGKKVGNGQSKNLVAHTERMERAEEQLSGVTLQDLINVVAFQEYKDQGVYAEEPEKVVPLTVENEDGTKRQVGTATTIPGKEGYVNVYIDDEDLRQELSVARKDVSIDFEDPNTQAIIKAASTIDNTNEENI